MLRFLTCCSGLLGVVAASALADGPQDNVPTSVRRIPKAGIEIPPDVRAELEAGIDEVDRLTARIPKSDRLSDHDALADVLVCKRAVHDALKYQEFFTPQEIPKARELLELAKDRAGAAIEKKSPWTDQTGLVVRGYISRIDGSPQPYGLVIPENYTSRGSGRYRLDVWFHGRGETLSELNFLDERRKRVGEFAPADTIVLHPYGRYCNAFKFAGEVDVLEAIEAVRRNYRIDDDRISVRGFSMGGAACWQFAVHYSDRWFAANPGAGFAETAKFLRVFQQESVKPTWYEQALWHLYDSTDYAGNLRQCPTVAYSGELDGQKQAADVMAEALLKEKIDLVHVIGPKTKHAYHPRSRIEVDQRLASLADAGRKRLPGALNFTTYTLKYNRMNWITIDVLGEHWQEARVEASFDPAGVINIVAKNVTSLTLDFPPGYSPFPLGTKVMIHVNGSDISDDARLSDRSWKIALTNLNGQWSPSAPPVDSVRKRHDLQGPIDDAFMDSFVFVRPTGKSSRAKFQAWVDAEMPRAIEHWRRHFRGEPRVKDDDQIEDLDVASANLVLWGDPESNSVLRKVADRLPFSWDPSVIKTSDQAFDSENHALIMIYPNPLNPSRYVVLNSGFTFREYDYLNNARQVPKLPDWAVIDLRTPPDARSPGKVVAADFFGESWEPKPGSRDR